MPELLRQGKVYIAETPLFEIELAKGKSRFAYTVEEKEKILSKLEKDGVKIKKIHRSKGLGENDKEMLWETTMDPKTRRLVQLKIDTNDEGVRKMTDMLFGVDTDNYRKEYIFNKLKEGLIDLDLDKQTLLDDKELEFDMVV